MTEGKTTMPLFHIICRKRIDEERGLPRICECLEFNPDRKKSENSNQDSSKKDIPEPKKQDRF